MNNIYLSPHLDDAVLSCGGLIAIQVAHRDYVRVINFFAGVPDLEEHQFSPYAQKQHLKWELKPKEAVIERRKEDQEVLERLGATVENWDYYDAIYRASGNQFLYTNHQELFGLVHSAEHALIDILVVRLESLYQDSPSTVFYAPLWVGGHVDHLIVRNCAIKLHQQGAIVKFYEDFPYVARKDWKDEPTTSEKARAGVPFQWKEELIPIDREAKVEAIKGYKSQMKSLFGDWEGIGLAHDIDSYAADLRQEKGIQEEIYLERYWTLV